MNDDTISRQAAIDAIKSVPEGNWKNKRYTNEIEKLPSAERRGRWEDVEHAPNDLFYATCSVCKERQTIEVANYCPMCGAKMEGERE